MPKKVKDFSKGLIYKLCCKDPTIKEIYIGSTTNFTQRKRSHKNTCNLPSQNRHNLKVYQYIRANGGWLNWDMVLIEYYPCGTELELCRREDYWKQELQASLNTQTPHIYENRQDQYKEYYQQNKEHILEHNKEYYQQNKEKIAEKVKEYYETNKEQILEYQKEYREANKETANEKMKEYRQKNRQQLSARAGEKIICECGCEVRRGNIAIHRKSVKHLSILEKRNPLDLNIQYSSS